MSAGCKNCYAERMAARNLPGMRSPTTGEPFAVRTPGGPRWTGRVELIPSKLDEPLRWRKPRRVFVNSMSDLFHEKMDAYNIAEVWARMAAAEQHTFQVLTKRADRLPGLLSDPEFRTEVDRRMYVLDPPAGGPSIPRYTQAWPLPNVWLGTSVEDQATADLRIPKLLQTPAAVRFISYEPALGPVDLHEVGPFPDGDLLGTALFNHGSTLDGAGLDWVIVGGESGPGARPFDVAWARSVVRQCREAGVPVFVKQLGAKPNTGCPCGCEIRLKSKKGGDPSEWPEDLRVREWPAVRP